MKIIIDGRCLMGDSYSGVSWYAYNLIKNLLALDQYNQYALFYNSSKNLSLPSFSAPNLEVKRFYYPNKLLNASLYFFNQPKLDRLAGNGDLFFSPNLHFSAFSSGIKRIVAIHDLSFLVNPGFFTIKQRLWHRLVLKNIKAKTDLFIADSYSTKNDLINLLKIKEEKIKVVYLGVDDKFFQIISEERKKAIQEKYSLPDRFLLFVGTIEPRKNLLAIITALEQAGWPLPLVIAGCYGWKSNKIKEIVSRDKNIKHLGYAEEEDKPALYQLAQALVYPSYYEGFGLPILESMASGCPVIAGNNSSQGEVLGDCGLLVDPFNIREIRQAIELLIDNNHLRNDFVGRGRARAQEFSWSKTAGKVLNIFEN